MKRMFLSTISFIVVLLVFSPVIFAKVPRINLVRSGDVLVKAKFRCFATAFDIDLLKNPLLYYKPKAEAPPLPIEPKEECDQSIKREKAPFKELYKYVSESEINEMETIIKGVPLISQFPQYPTGCESVAAVSLMNYLGYDITVDDFIDNYLETNNSFYYKDGQLQGPSPFEYFLGDPRSKSSWGCMSPVIAKAMTEYLGNDKVHLLENVSLDELCCKYIDKGTPAIVWVSIHMLEITHTACWYLDNGEKYFWPSNEHCMILIGYDDWYYYFSDPYVPAILRFKKELATDRYTTMGQQAIIVNNDP